MLKSLLIAIFAAVLINASKAEANDYDIPATGCVPTGQSIFNNWYMWTGTVATGISQPGITHIPSTTATVSFHCAIHHPLIMGQPSVLRLLYTDSSSAFQNNVTAYYKKVHKTTGVQTTIAVLSTQNCPVGTGACSMNFSDAFNPLTYRYYVEVNLQRTSTANTMIFWGVTLF